MGRTLTPTWDTDPRVLLVDDAAAIRNALRGLLEDAGAFAFPPKHCGADRIRETVVAVWRSGAGDTA